MELPAKIGKIALIEIIMDIFTTQAAFLLCIKFSWQ
jgi:hypothetical protein